MYIGDSINNYDFINDMYVFSTSCGECENWAKTWTMSERVSYLQNDKEVWSSEHQRLFFREFCLSICHWQACCLKWYNNNWTDWLTKQTDVVNWHKIQSTAYFLLIGMFLYLKILYGLACNVYPDRKSWRETVSQHFENKSCTYQKLIVIKIFYSTDLPFELLGKGVFLFLNRSKHSTLSDRGLN